MRDLLDTEPELQKHFAKMDAPIPGEGMVSDPDDPYPWEQPPEFTVLEEAVDYLFVSLTEEEALAGLVDSALNGATIMELSKLALFKGFTEGKWNTDLMLMLVEPTSYMIMGLLERSGVDDYIIMEDEDEDLFGAEVPEEMMEGLKEKEVPEEVQEKISETPSLMARQ